MVYIYIILYNTMGMSHLKVYVGHLRKLLQPGPSDVSRSIIEIFSPIMSNILFIMYN